MDSVILFWIQSHLQSPGMDSFFRIFTLLVNNGLIWFLLIGCLFIKKDRRYTALVMTVSAVLAVLCVQYGLKPLINRTRPYIAYNMPILIPPPRGPSFPSSHSAVAFAAAWAYFITQEGRERWIPVVLAALVAFSRLYLFVHYPSDVVVGIVTGCLFAYIGQALIERLDGRFHWNWVNTPADDIPPDALKPPEDEAEPDHSTD
jgi:undecaprenyl-diphosphatase